MRVNWKKGLAMGLGVCMAASVLTGCGKGKELARIRKVFLFPCDSPLHPESDEDYLTRKPGLYPDLLQEI